MKKLISVLIAAIIVFNAFTFLCSAQDEPKVINGIDITVRTDVAGKTLRDYEDLFVFNTEGVECDPEYYNGSPTSDYIDADDVFVAGKEYKLPIHLIAKPGYVFPEYDYFTEKVRVNDYQNPFYFNYTKQSETDGHTYLVISMPNPITVDKPEEEITNFDRLLKLLDAFYDIVPTDETEQTISATVKLYQNIIIMLHNMFPNNTSLLFRYQNIINSSFTTDRIVDDIVSGNISDIESLMCKDIKTNTADLHGEIAKMIGMIDGRILEYYDHSGGSGSDYRNYGVSISTSSDTIRFKTTEVWYEVIIVWQTINTVEPDEIGIIGIYLTRLDGPKNEWWQLERVKLCSIDTDKEFMP